MTILCIEGPSAVGKTTVCRLLEADHGFVRIAEVNEHFVRGPHEAPLWYFERQVERWRMAQTISSAGGVALLDGDALQPLWYNWIFAQDAAQSMADTLVFYRAHMERGTLGLPDRYFVLISSEDALRARKAADASRTRRNFDRHLQLIAPQLAYFSAMQDTAPDRVRLLQADDVRQTADAIAREAVAAPRDESSARAFEAMAAFVSGTHPSPSRRLP
jgi:hypothetical protein